MAVFGKANRDVIQNLISKMHKFNDLVEQEIVRMNERTENLGETWKDAQYRQFHEYILDLSESLRQDLRIIQETADTLQNRVNEF